MLSSRRSEFRGTAMALDEVKAIARRVIDEAVNEGDLSVVDEIFR